MRLLKMTIVTIVTCATTVFSFVQLLYGQGAGHLPLTVVLSERTVGPQGQVRETQVIRAVRTDGSIVEATQYRDEDGSLQEVRSIVDLKTGQKIVVTSAKKSTTTYYYTGDQIDNLSRPYSCPRDGGVEGSVMGYRVISDTVDLPTPQGDSYKATNYYAPELGCMPIESVMVQVEADGSTHEVKHTEAVRITIGEPNPALFLVPDDYSEMSPTELFKQSSASTPANDVLAQRLESDYRAKRADRGR